MIFAAGCGTGTLTAPVTESEAMIVRATIDRAITATDAQPLTDLMDRQELARRVAKHATGVSESQIEASLRDDRSMSQLFEQIMTAVRSGKSLKFVRAYPEGNTWHLVYRIFGDGLNYFDWELIRTGPNVRIADVMVYMSGENLSRTVGETLNPGGALSAGMRSVIMPDLRRLRGHLNDGEFEQASRIYDAWPPSVKESRMFRLVHTQILSGLGKDNEYVEELEKLAVDYPDSRNVPLLMIDVYLLQKKYDKALESINRLDKFVGGDPFLDFYRAQLAQERGDTAAYRGLVRNAFAAEKDIDALTIEMMYVSILTGDTSGLDAGENALRNSRNYDPGVRQRLQELAKEPATAGQ